jgi:hypothetical protein
MQQKHKILLQQQYLQQTIKQEIKMKINTSEAFCTSSWGMGLIVVQNVKILLQQ